jgi:pimeloyl-ACP methyl ester carboxylesterase
VALQRWPADGPRILLIHGLTGMAESWWQVGPALAARGYDVTAVDQAGHGGRPLSGEATPDALADAVLELYPDGPEVLIGHSLGSVTALALLEREPGWARTVILEEPPTALTPEVSRFIAETVAANAAAVREDRGAFTELLRAGVPRWADEDVHWAVQGIAEVRAEPFVRRFEALARHPPVRAGDRILAAAPDAYVLVGDVGRPAAEGGSVLSADDRDELAARLPAGHVIELDGGHCLHRDAPGAWLAAVLSIIG